MYMYLHVLYFKYIPQYNSDVFKISLRKGLKPLIPNWCPLIYPFHLKVHPEPTKYSVRLRQLGVKAGISINPDVTVEETLPYLKDFDFLLLMSVFPGFGGQKFIDETMKKIKTARSYINAQGLSTQIAVDGGVDENNAAAVVEAGADILVMGTAFFGSQNRRHVIELVENDPNTKRKQ